MPPDAFIDYPALYHYRFCSIDQHRRELVWSEVSRYLYRILECPERILDPAAGHGEFINSIPAHERWAVDFVDQSQHYVSGVRSIVSDIYNAKLPRDYFDAIFVSNFLEHLPNQEKVAELLLQLRNALKPGGRIAVMGPNFKYCFRQYFDCADHLLAITHISVTEHLYAAGFDVEEVIPRFLPLSFRGFLPSSPSLTSAYLRFPFLWRILGRQFLVVARRQYGDES